MPRSLALTAKRSNSGSAMHPSIDSLSASAASAAESLQALPDDMDVDTDKESTVESFHSCRTQLGEEDATALLQYGTVQADQISSDADDLSDTSGTSTPTTRDYRPSHRPEDAEFEAMIRKLRKTWNRFSQAQQTAIEWGDDSDQLRDQFKRDQRTLHELGVDLFLEDVALEVKEREAVGEIMEPGSDLEKLLQQREDLDARRMAFREESRTRDRVFETQLRCFGEDDQLRAKEKNRLAFLKAKLLQVGDDLSDWTAQEREELESEMVEKRAALGASTGY